MVVINGKDYADVNDYLEDSLMALNKSLMAKYKVDEEE